MAPVVIILRMRRAIFLDRDGVVIENRAEYVRSWDDVHIYSDALDGLKRLSASDYLIIIVTNQSVVGRGIIPLHEAEEINQRLVLEIETGLGRIDGLLMCPHSPEDGCSCRKPKPGMFFEAAEKWSIDLGRSIMVGDAATDLQAAREAGISELFLVLTGRGRKQLHVVGGLGLDFKAFDSLGDVISFLLSENYT